MFSFVNYRYKYMDFSPQYIHKYTDINSVLVIISNYPCRKNSTVELLLIPGWVATWNVELHSTVSWLLRGGRGLQI
jgi:hypothetical protein